MIGGVLIVEANISSGSMITANFAAELGREVFLFQITKQAYEVLYVISYFKMDFINRNPTRHFNFIKPLTIKELNVNNTYNSEFIKPTEMTFINQNEITNYVYDLLCQLQLILMILLNIIYILQTKYKLLF